MTVIGQALTAFLPAIIVQTATGWPEADEGWTIANNVIPLSASEGLGQTIGTAEMEETIGSMSYVGGNQLLEFPRQITLGCYIRLLCEDSAGSVTYATPEGETRKYTPFWWGIATANQEPIRGSSQTVISWSCSDLKIVLERILCGRGFTLSGGQIVDLGFMPPVSGGLYGPSTGISIDGAGVSSIGLASPGLNVAQPWYASSYVGYLLAAHSRYIPPGATTGDYGPRWRLDPASSFGGSTDWQMERGDFDGVSLLSALNTIINQRRGLCWTYRVAAGFIYITVTSCLPGAPVNLNNSGSLQILTASPQRTLDVTTGIFYGEPRYSPDTSGADVIRVIGDRPQITMTLGLSAAVANAIGLEPDGWLLTDVPEAAGGVVDGTWTRFRIAATWNGAIGSTGAPSDTDAARNFLTHPMADGSRQWQANMPPRSAVQVQRTLAFGVGGALTGEPVGAIVTSGSSAGQCEDLTAEIQMIPLGPGKLQLGSSVDHAWRLRDAYYNNQCIRVTLALEEWAPLQASYVRPRSEWPSEVPRVMEYRIPGAGRLSYAAGAITGVNRGTALTNSMALFGSPTDNSGLLIAAAGLLRARYLTQGGTLTWGQLGTIDIGTTYAPGAFVAAVKNASGTRPVNSTVSARRWVFRGEAGTSYQTTRPELDVSAIVSVPKDYVN